MKKILISSILAGCFFTNLSAETDFNFLKETIKSTNTATIKLINNQENFENRLLTQEKINKEQDKRILILEKKVNFLLKRKKVYNKKDHIKVKNPLIENFINESKVKKEENITKQTNKLIKSEIKTNSEVKVTRITKETKKKNIEIIRPTVPKGTSGSEVIMLNKPINFIVKSKSASYHDNPSPHKRKDLIGKDKTVIGVGFNKYGWVLLDNKKWVKGYILEPRLYPIQE
jgi:hypothetical protein